jgi:hypothetical protein
VKQIRARLTYANAMSSIAVFLVLGGATALAAGGIGTNDLKAGAVTTAKLQKNAVTTAKIKKNAVTTAKIKKNAVTGAKVRNGTLTAADISAATLTPTCPSGTLLAEGVCIETAARPAAPFNESVDTCTALGRRLPSVNELIGFTRKVQTIPAQERSGDLFAVSIAFNVNPDGTPITNVPLTTPTPYRCVGAPTP